MKKQIRDNLLIQKKDKTMKDENTRSIDIEKNNSYEEILEHAQEMNKRLSYENEKLNRKLANARNLVTAIRYILEGMDW